MTIHIIYMYMVPYFCLTKPRYIPTAIDIYPNTIKPIPLPRLGICLPRAIGQAFLGGLILPCL